MFRSGGAGSNIPKGPSSRQAVPTLSGSNSIILLRLTLTKLAQILKSTLIRAISRGKCGCSIEIMLTFAFKLSKENACFIAQLTRNSLKCDEF